MKNLFLPDSKELNRLSEIFRLTKEDLKKKITKGLQKFEIDLDSTFDAGKPLSNIIDDYGFALFAIVLSILGRSDNEVNELFGNLYYKNVLDDCPECGCETEEEEDGAWGHTWTEKKCTNSECDYFETNEPDWDLKRDIALDR